MYEFDAKGFMAYMHSQFQPMENHFTYDLVENVALFAARTYAGDVQALAGFLSGVIPEVRADEICRFISAEDDQKKGS